MNHKWITNAFGKYSVYPCVHFFAFIKSESNIFFQSILILIWKLWITNGSLNKYFVLNSEHKINSLNIDWNNKLCSNILLYQFLINAESVDIHLLCMNYLCLIVACHSHTALILVFTNIGPIQFCNKFKILIFIILYIFTV